MSKDKKLPGLHVVSSSDYRREVIELYKDEKDIMRSRTIHERKIGGNWTRKIVKASKKG